MDANFDRAQKVETLRKLLRAEDGTAVAEAANVLFSEMYHLLRVSAAVDLKSKLIEALESYDATGQIEGFGFLDHCLFIMDFKACKSQIRNVLE